MNEEEFRKVLRAHDRKILVIVVVLLGAYAVAWAVTIWWALASFGHRKVEQLGHD